MISQSDINGAKDWPLLCMGYVAAGLDTNSRLGSVKWYDALPSLALSIWNDILFDILHDAIGKPISGAMPHPVFAMITPDLETASGCTMGAETDAAFFKRALIAIIYPQQ